MACLNLHPSIFETHSEIDTYYDPLIFAIQTDWTQMKCALKVSCNEPNCEAALKS
jgi:hypothetical protein